MANVFRYKLMLMMICLGWLSGIVHCAAQNYRLNIMPVDTAAATAIKSLGLKNSFATRAQYNDYVKQLPALLLSKGYISASLDSVQATDNHSNIYLYLGAAYRLVNIRIHDQDLLYLQQAGWKNGLASAGMPFSQYTILQTSLLDQFEQSGYPFATVKLDSLSINGSDITAALQLDKGNYYRVDSIRLFGPAKISRNFIHRYLDIPMGSGYNSARLNKINQRLLELPYLQQAQPWDVTMLNTGSIVNLYLQPKKSNQINVLAGFLPANQQTGGKLLFTIDANLQLKNAFGNGEYVGVVWQQIQPRSPRLNLNYQQPYLFNSPFGVDFNFQLYKRDSLFLNLLGELGVNYQFSTEKTIKISVQNQRTNVLEIDTQFIKNNRQLPDVADVSSVNLGINYNYQHTDYRYNPRKGNEVNLNVVVGTKKIRKSNTITQIKDPAFDFNTLYDSLALSSYQVRLQLIAAHYLSLGRQSVLKAGINSGWYQSPNNFRNELFQIGGYKLLRGFDEESIFANRYAVATIEYRYLIGLNSYFFGFTDVGWSGYKTSLAKLASNYIGGGVGLAFETKGGIFNLSYAAGKRNDVPFNVKESKIHIGYVSVF